ncbi:MAG TPA: immunoglobulin-like domain-containing protein [Solirubrobacterales bacterium]|nr:immunoglobulin-like domain-containing protein [Solirubrobacterales bacterium]
MPLRERSGLLRLPAMVAGLAILLIALTTFPARATAAEPEPAFCASETLHDYLAPLQGMPKLRELPFRARGEMRFHGAYIGASGPSLAISGGSAGYQLQWDRNQNWEITVTFARVDRRGKVIHQLGRRHFRLGALAPATITEPHIILPGKPALYRTTLVIRSHSGRRLAEFGNYYRVIRPTVHTHLALTAPTYHPGDTLFARVENPGAAVVLFGQEYAIEQPEGESWVPIVEAQFVIPLYWVAAGMTSSHCIPFQIPPTMPPGHYRLTQEAVISWPRQKRQLRPKLHAAFDLVP